ncbi:MAG: AzlC family ABC transporter permease [Acidimicrobiales bacterium]|nr:AzlC family ABC transporter permease [Acidimicrobiales bacterium]
MSPSVTRSELTAGARAVAPMLVGVIPFGLVAGATPATTGLGGGVSIGLSTIVFAGASQLAAADALADGGSALVAVIAACTINLRLLLYSASLAPHLAAVPLRRRLLMGYLLTDQAYAVSITRWTAEADGAARGGPPAPGLERKVPYYLGAALLLWANWQVCTIIGVLIGSAVPDSLPLDFAVPLVFLVLLVPAITSRPALVAAITGGMVALLAGEVGAGHLGVLFGALGGIAAGAVAEAALERQAARDETPLPPDPGPAP